MTADQADIYRAMDPARRLRLAFGLHDFAYRRVLAAVSRERPDLSEREVCLEVLRRFIGEPGGVLHRGAGSARA
jgi:hypothetical protein